MTHGLMTHTHALAPTASLSAALQYLLAMDMEPVKFKLMKEEGWTLSRCDDVEKKYKGFLQLILQHPGEVFVPSLDVDEMWHTHILDTRKYMADCRHIFGEYLHHYPYLGMKDESDAAALGESFADTRERYKALLGFDIFSNSNAAECGGGCGGGCGSSCGSSSCSSAPSSCSNDTPSSPSSCTTVIPAACGGVSKPDKDKEKDKEKDKKKNNVKKPGFRMSQDEARWLHSTSPAGLDGQYRPGRAEVEAASLMQTRH